MKRFLRFVCLFMAVATLMAIPAYAQEASSRASAYLSSYRAYCSKASSNQVVVSYQVIGAGIMDEIGVSQVKVQYSTDKVNWTTQKTFNKANYPSMTDTDTGSHGGMLYCTVPVGKYYRAYVTFYAAKDNGFAERYYYTAII